MKGRTAYEIVLDRLAESQREAEHSRAERDVAQSALREAQVQSQRQDRLFNAQRDQLTKLADELASIRSDRTDPQ